MPRVQLDNDLAQLAARIPSRLHRAIKLAATHDGVTVREWVADAVAVHLREVTGTDGDRNAPESSGDALRRPARARG